MGLFSLFETSETTQSTTAQQVGVQGGAGATVGIGAGASGGVGGIRIETTDPAAFETLGQANYIVGQVAQQGINYANQSLIKSLETLQAGQSRFADLAAGALGTAGNVQLGEIGAAGGGGAAGAAEVIAAAAAKPLTKKSWLLIGAVIVGLFVIGFFFLRK
jgi:hypothetical protein